MNSPPTLSLDSTAFPPMIFFPSAAFVPSPLPFMTENNLRTAHSEKSTTTTSTVLCPDFSSFNTSSRPLEPARRVCRVRSLSFQPLLLTELFLSCLRLPEFPLPPPLPELYPGHAFVTTLDAHPKFFSFFSVPSFFPCDFFLLHLPPFVSLLPSSTLPVHLLPIAFLYPPLSCPSRRL